MTTKICIKCSFKKNISDFYKGQGDCKECTKQRVKLREEKLRLDPIWAEKERARHREKYDRLNYKESQKIWDKDKPWKSTSKYKNLHRDFKVPKGFQLHHWNYNNEFLQDVILISKASHKEAHTKLKFDDVSLMFFDLEGNLLDSKEKHLIYLINSKIKI